MAYPYHAKAISSFDKFSRLLFFILSLELILGGGGRITAVGPVSLRMVLFGLAMIATAIHFLRGDRLPPHYRILCMLFAAMLAVGIAVGLINDSPTSAIREDVKPLLYFFLLPFAYFSTRDLKVVDSLSQQFRISGIGMAIVFISTLVLINTGIVPFLSFYSIADATSEFFFRGEITFFYKGFLYLCISFIFLNENKSPRWQLIIVAIAIILTVTRGFWIALLITYGCYYLIFKQRSIKTLLAGIVMIVLALLLVWRSQQLIGSVSETIDTEITTTSGTQSTEAKPFLLGDRLHSDNVRKRQVNEVMDRSSWRSAITGHGFGQGVPIRPVHMEISYLEIFHKQGLVGLVIWLLIFLYGLRLFILSMDNPLSVPFFLSFAFVFVQSLSNQYVNNPIGLFMVIVGITCLDRSEARVTTLNSLR
jgi:hypothetical protein